MGILEAFFGATVAGLGALLMTVASMAWRRAGDAKMGILTGAFAAQMAAGIFLLMGEIFHGSVQMWAPMAFAGATLTSMALIYGALFARRPQGRPAHER